MQTHSTFKFCTRGVRRAALAGLVPTLAMAGAWIDSMALRGNFRPVISSYHAICARQKRDARCARLIRFAPFPKVEIARD